MFWTREDEFIVEPLWNETSTISYDDDAAAAAAAGGVQHVIYRRSAVKTRAVHRCALHGLYTVTSLLDDC